MRRSNIEMAYTYSNPLRSPLIILWLVPPTLASLICLAVLPSNYALFHMLAEFASISAGLISLVLAIVLIGLARHQFIAYIGMGLGWIACLDFIHMLAYEGMNIVPADNVNIAAQFWLSARYLNAFVLVTAPFFITRSFPPTITNLAMLLYCILCSALIYSGIFPDTFLDNEGLTAFKIYSEYLIILTFMIAAYFTHKRKHLLPHDLLIMIYWALAFSVLSEFFFTLYGSATDTLNALGHIAKIFAYWFIFLAIVRFNLHHPLNLLFQSSNAYDLVTDAVVVTDPSGNIVEANEAAGKLCNAKKDAILGQPAHSLFHDSEISSDSCDICTRLKKNSALLEKRLDKGGHYFDIYAKTIDDHQGSLASLQLIRDVTEKVDYESRIQQKRDLLDKLSEQIPGVIYQFKLNPDGSSNFPFLTDQTQKIFDVPPHELEKDASPVFDKIHEDDLAVVNESILESAKNLSVWQRDFRIVLSDGEIVWRTAYATPERLEDGSVLWHGYTSDSTELHKMNEELKKSVDDLKKSVETTLKIVDNMVQIRDPYTAGHEQRVGLIASKLARKLGWSTIRCDQMNMIGLIHDVGKISVPAEILSKPGKLSEYEYSLIKEHAKIGFDILSPINFEFPLPEAVLQHHERLDGSGYPQGLKGEQIIMEARILAVADVFESMTSHRPYRPARTFNEALDELTNGKSVLYDENVVDALVELEREGSLVLG